MPGPETNCGVYMMRCKKTGQSYIGASLLLVQRLRTHAAAIRNRSGKDSYLAAFPCVDDVEFRVLEYCVVDDIEADSKESYEEWSRQLSRQQAQIAQMYQRESYWIVKLKPTLNIQKKHKRIELVDLPFGPPEE